MGAIANRLPMMVVAELIGVPGADIAQLVQWGYAATQLLEGLVSEEQLAAAGAAVLELSGYITDQFAARRPIRRTICSARWLLPAPREKWTRSPPRS